MQTTLIMLPQPILVGGEIKGGDFYFKDDKILQWVKGTSVTYSHIHPSDYPKPIIAGIEGLPKLDLSAIAEEIGWVDVDRLALDSFDGDDIDFGIYWGGFDKGFRAAQSLNEKKYSEEEIEQFYIWKDENRWFNFSNGKWNYTFEHGTVMSKSSYEKNYRKTTKELMAIWLKQRKPKEYNVECIQEGNTIKVINIIN